MFTRRYNDTLASGEINYHVEFSSDLVTLLDVRADLITPYIASSVNTAPGADTLTSNSNYDFIADIEVEGRRFTLGLEDGSLIVTPMMFIYPNWQPIMRGKGYTVNSIAHKGEVHLQSLAVNYPENDRDYIANPENGTTNLAPGDINIAGISIVEYTNTPQLLGVFTREGTAKKLKRLLYVSVPLVASQFLRGFFPVHTGPDNMEFYYKPGGADTSNIYIPIAF